MAADAAPRVPAWKRLGLKLAKDTSSTTENTTDVPQPTTTNTPTKRKHTSSTAAEPPIKRKKSVTFASDVKVSDGSATDDLLTSHLAAQTGATDDEFSAAEAAAFVVPKSHPGNEPGVRRSAADKKRKREERNQRRDAQEKEQEQEQAQGTLPPVLAYLKQFHEDHTHWKFNKNVQNVLFKHLYSPERVPAAFDEALAAYLDTLQGDGAKARLAEGAVRVLAADGDVAAGKQVDMDDPAVRERAKQAALDRHLLATKVRLREAQDAQTANGEAHERKLFARRRAAAILQRFEALLPSRKRSLEEELEERVGAAEGAERPAKRRVRVRKSRTGIDEDDQSDVSSVDGEQVLKDGGKLEGQTAEAEEDSGDDSSSISSSSEEDSSDDDDSSSEESNESSDDSSSDDE